MHCSLLHIWLYGVRWGTGSREYTTLKIYSAVDIMTSQVGRRASQLLLACEYDDASSACLPGRWSHKRPSVVRNMITWLPANEAICIDNDATIGTAGDKPKGNQTFFSRRSLCLVSSFVYLPKCRAFTVVPGNFPVALRDTSSNHLKYNYSF